jgi:hypothetical protein
VNFAILRADHKAPRGERALMISLRRRGSVVLAALLAPLLSACFMSEAPKFPLASAAAPFGAEARFGLYERGEDKIFARQETVVVKRRSDGGYDFVNDKGEAVPISLHDIGNGRFAGQSKSEKDRADYSYLVFRMNGPEVLVYLPDCGEQDKALLARFNVDVRSGDECAIDRVADPAGLLAAVELGEPNSKLMKE